MFKVAIINEFKDHMVLELPIIPRKGDIIPVFYVPYPQVKEVLLMPEKLGKEYKGLDAVITV